MAFSLREMFSSPPGGNMSNFIFRIILRFLQFVMAITVAGLYGVDLNNAQKEDKYADSKWVYAEVVAGLAAVTALVYMVPFVQHAALFTWDWILFILWIALFGLFGDMYIKEDAEGNSGVQRMKNAVWVDLVNVILWFITATYGTIIFVMGRRGRTLHTGRAHV